MAIVFAVVWWQFGESTVSAVAVVLSALLGVIALVQSGGRVAPAVPTQTELEDTAKTLAGIITQQWTDEADSRRLRDPEPAAVYWTEAEESVSDYSGVVFPAPSSAVPEKQERVGRALTGRIDVVVDEFCNLPRKRLVVTGEPGAGKTALLLLLTLGLLKRWRLEEPIPVLLNVSSWDPTRDGLRHWLSKRISTDYKIGPRLIQNWVADSRVLPVLDGLDELQEGMLVKAIAAINRIGIEQPLVIACRGFEFAEAVHSEDVVTGAAVVRIAPVDPEDARNYLSRTTPPDRLARWDRVFDELGSGSTSPIAKAFDTPLMLSLARSVYTLDRNADPGELIDRNRFPTPVAIEDHLLDALVPAAFGSASGPSGTNARWTVTDAHRWLTFLAQLLGRHKITDFGWWDLGPSGRIFRLCSSLLLVGAAAGCGFGIIQLSKVPPLGVAGAAVSGVGIVALGLFYGAVFIGPGVSFFGLLWTASPARLVLRLDRTFVNELSRGLLLAALIAAGTVVGIWLTGYVLRWEMRNLDTTAALTLFALVFVGVLAAGVLSGVIRGSDRPPAPADSLSADRGAAAVTVVAFGLVGAVVGLVFGAVQSPPEIDIGLYGTGFGIAVGLIWAWSGRPWTRYQVARSLCALRGQLPWSLMTFLEDAHRLGVLRQAGAAYQFQHVRLQGRLAGDAGSSGQSQMVDPLRPGAC